jgi:hypothetical protein
MKYRDSGIENERRILSWKMEMRMVGNKMVEKK